MKPFELREAATALLHAYQTATPIAPLSEAYPDATPTDAYRIQQEQVRAWIEAGDMIRGHKIGLVSFAIQQQMGIHEPDYGHLTARMFHLEHQPIPARLFIQPRIEPEIAFVLKASLRGPGLLVADAAQAVEFMLPALEIVDSRIQGWRISIFDTIADNASSGGVILGSTPIRPDDVDLQSVSCGLFRNGVLSGTGTCDAVLGTPFKSLMWLANTIGSLGMSLEPGHVVLSGSITRAIPIAPGDTVTADIMGVGEVTAVLSDGDVG